MLNPVLAAAPATLVIGSHPSSINADQVISFTAYANDSNGNPVNSPVNWSSSSGVISSDGKFVPGAVGMVNVTAEVEGLLTSTSLTVTPGFPVDVKSLISVPEARIDLPFNLSATLVDRANNHVVGDLDWRADNGDIDQQNSTWYPEEVGPAILRAIWFELEVRINMTVIPGPPVSIEIPYGLTVQSGSSLEILPVAHDALGNEVGVSKAGILSWSVEDGTITPSGVYVGTNPGVWNLTVNSTSGASGVGTIHVLPAQSTGLSIQLNDTQVRAGSPVILEAIRTDVLGNQGPVLISLSNWTTPSGSLSLVDNQVVWNPTKIGTWIIGVHDQGFSDTIQVDVIQGLIIGVEILLSEDELRSGESISASLSAFDAAGNHRSVSAAWTVSEELGGEQQEGWMLIRPGPIGNHSLSATWFDNETQVTHETTFVANIKAGELARIILPESGTRVTSDGVVDLNPRFEDANGNLVSQNFVTWIVDGNDATMEIRMSEGLWAPSTLGMHEIRAMADGVFAITEIEVIPGSARHLTTDIGDNLVLISGEAIEIEINTLDVHGNSAPASEMTFIFDDPKGIVTPSPSGDGNWLVEGGEVGSWNLRMISGSAISDISIVVDPGEPVRLIAELPNQNPEEGTTMMIRIHAVDEVGNIVTVPEDETEISCTTGPASHMAGDTYQIVISESGTSQSCTIKWNGMIAQRFFDVEAVLFGGSLGNSNTALSLVSVIVLLFLGIMLVLIRRLSKSEENDDDLWDDEEDYEEVDDIDSDLKIEDEVVKSSPIEETVIEDKVVEEESSNVEEESTEEMRNRLAKEAQRTGVMQAAPGTEQGKTGWYIDSTGELTSWLVSDSGEWTRVS
jgi:hypothetical protein